MFITENNIIALKDNLIKSYNKQQFLENIEDLPEEEYFETIKYILSLKASFYDDEFINESIDYILENVDFIKSFLEKLIRVYLKRFKENIPIDYISYQELYRFWWDDFSLVAHELDPDNICSCQFSVLFEDILEIFGTEILSDIPEINKDGFKWVKDYDCSGKAFYLSPISEEIAEQIELIGDKQIETKKIIDNLFFKNKTNLVDDESPKEYFYDNENPNSFTPKYGCEHDLEQYLRYGCRLINWKCEKQDPKVLGKGVPDRKIIKTDGTIVYVELKSPKETGSLSHHQIEYHEKLRDQGYEVKVIWSKEQVDKLLNEETI